MRVSTKVETALSGQSAALRGDLYTACPWREGPVSRQEMEQKLEQENPGAAVLAFGGDTLLVGRDDGQIIAYDAQTLALRHEFTVEGQNQPRFVTAAPGGQHFAVVFHHGALWIYDRDADELIRPRITGQRDISCCLFPAPDRVLVAGDAVPKTDAYCIALVGRQRIAADRQAACERDSRCV